MSRFNSQAYDKLFPREVAPVTPPETSVDGFHPTKDKAEGKEPDVVDVVTPETSVDDIPLDPVPAPEDPGDN